MMKGVAVPLWWQGRVQLRPRPRGFHLITDEVLQALPVLDEVQVGLLQVFIQHTSASLAINENADSSVRGDLERHFNHMVPEGASYFRHTLEGPDDMPAHIKSVLIGPSVTVPVGAGALLLGTWQGLYLCEHRDQGGARSLILTLQGQRHS